MLWNKKSTKISSGLIPRPQFGSIHPENQPMSDPMDYGWCKDALFDAGHASYRYQIGSHRSCHAPSITTCSSGLSCGPISRCSCRNVWGENGHSAGNVKKVIGNIEKHSQHAKHRQRPKASSTSNARVGFLKAICPSRLTNPSRS